MIRSSVLRGVAAAGLSFCAAKAPAAVVVHGQIDVVQIDGGNAASSITLTTPVASPGFGLNGGNRGDFNLGLNMTLADGIPMSVVRQNGRDNDPFGGGLGGVADTPFGGIRYASSAVDRTGTNAWFIPVFNSSNASDAGGDEFNMNVAVAYFPYTDYLGGWFRNAAGTNGGVNNELTSAHPSLVVGTHVIDQYIPAIPATPETPAVPAVNPGRTTVDFRTLEAKTRSGSVLASSATGILLATGGKNEDNYAMTLANDDGTFTVFSHDNGANGTSFEQDFVAFVYIAANDPNTTAMGRILNDGSAVAGTSSGDFTITKGSSGIWYLTIAGQSDSTGTLMITPAGETSGNTPDNLLSYEWDPANNRWEIQTRDLPNMGLQDAGAGVAAFSFAFFSVPEPGSLSLLLAPVALLLKRRRR